MWKARTRWIYGDSEFRARLRDQGLEDLAALSSPCLGTFVTGHRSSWVRRVEDGPNAYYVKTYDYPTWSARCRGAGRNTWLGRSRPRREQQALTWLADRGFEAPRVRAVVESRVLGVLARAVLVTDAWPGEPLSTILPTREPRDRQAILATLEDFVQSLHAAGFRDGNLDLRNILGRYDGSGWRFAKIDSPRFHVVRNPAARDARAVADWHRLGRDLAALGLALPSGSDRRPRGPAR